mgnify:FL=1
MGGLVHLHKPKELRVCTAIDGEPDRGLDLPLLPQLAAFAPESRHLPALGARKSGIALVVIVSGLLDLRKR